MRTHICMYVFVGMHVCMYGMPMKYACMYVGMHVWCMLCVVYSKLQVACCMYACTYVSM